MPDAWNADCRVMCKNKGIANWVYLRGTPGVNFTMDKFKDLNNFA